MKLTGLFLKFYNTIIVSFFESSFLKTIIASVSGVIGLLVDGNDKVITIILIVYLIDLITGVIKSIKQQDFSSRKFFYAAVKLLVYGVMGVIGVGLDKVFFSGSMFLSFFFAYILVTDTISVLENLDQLGFDVPVFFVKFLRVRKERLYERFMKGLTDDEIKLIRKFESRKEEAEHFKIKEKSFKKKIPKKTKK